MVSWITSGVPMEQIPVESAAALDRHFDLVVCTGVLHHLEDPDEGLRALRSVLKPDGAIYLMLYAPYGRAGVYLLQEYCRRGFAQKVLNPTHGSGWFIQMLSIRDLPNSVGIPPTVVGGLFKSLLRKDLKHPPTAVGGINVPFRNIFVERT